MISYKEKEETLLLSCMVVGDQITASIDPRAEQKTAVTLYLVIPKCTLINLWYPFFRALVDWLTIAYTSVSDLGGISTHMLALLPVDELVVFPLRPGPPVGRSSHASCLLESSVPAVAFFLPALTTIFLFCGFSPLSSLSSPPFFLHADLSGHSCQCLNEYSVWHSYIIYIYYPHIFV